MVAILFAYLLYISINLQDSIVARICRNRYLRFTGKISYGLYIFHWPFLFVSFALVGKISHFFSWHVSEKTLHTLGTIVALVITYGVSYTSFRYYESIFLKQKRRPVPTEAGTDN
jgi:peptidoglycan/LPS O-acetylase OafA/YrhL